MGTITVAPLASDLESGGAMLTKRIVPCLDVDAGRVVKGVRFSNLRDAGDPAELALAYEQQGADEIVLLDVSATQQGRSHAHDTVARVRAALSIPLTAGGGIRCTSDAAALLAAGADKVAVNTAAARDPALLERLAGRFGSQCTVLALDAARCAEGWELVIESGRTRTGRSAVAWAREAEQRGAGEIVLTSWDRDGTRSGYDTELLQAVSQTVGIPVVASGGAACAADLISAARAGASALLIASILHDGDTTVSELKDALATAGQEVRR